MTDLLRYKIYCYTEEEQKTYYANFPTGQCPVDAMHEVAVESEYVETVDDPTVQKFYRTSESVTPGQVVSLRDNKVAPGFATPAKHIFESKNAQTIAVCSPSTDLYVVAYRSDMSRPVSNNGYACVATVFGSSVTYGTAVCFEDGPVETISICAISATVVCIAYRGTSGFGYLVFGAISGSTITFGTPVVFTGEIADRLGSLIVVYTSTYLVAVYRDTANSGYGTWIAGVLSGSGTSTIATFGTAVVFNSVSTSANPQGIACCVIDANRVAVLFDNNDTSMKCVIGTCSGIGSSSTCVAGIISNALDTTHVVGGRNLSIALMSTNALMIAYRQTIDGRADGYVAILSITANSVAAASQAISAVGTPLKFARGFRVCSISISKLSTNYAIVYLDAGSLEIAILTANSSSPPVLTLQNTGSVVNATAASVSVGHSSAGLFIAHRDIGYFNTGVACVVAVNTSHVIDMYETKGRVPIGVVIDDVGANEVTKIQTHGYNSTYLNLTQGMSYYAHGDGSISPYPIAANNTYLPVKIGNTLSPTTVLLHI